MIERDKLLIEIAAKQSLLKQGPEELIGGRIYWQIRGLDLAADLMQGMGVEAEPVRHGYWEMFPAPVVSYRCSKCEKPLPFGLDISTKFCPNCGARMASASNAMGRSLAPYALDANSITAGGEER